MLVIPDATHTPAVCTEVAAHEGIATEEAEATGIGTTNRRTPHVAEAAHKVERAIVVAAAAANGPLQVTVKGTCRVIVWGPAQAFYIKLIISGHTPAWRAGVVDAVHPLP